MITILFFSPAFAFAEIALKCEKFYEWVGSNVTEEVFIKSDGIEYLWGHFIPWGQHSYEWGGRQNTVYASEYGSRWEWGVEVKSLTDHYKTINKINRVSGDYEEIRTQYKSSSAKTKIGTTVSRGSCELLKRKF